MNCMFIRRRFSAAKEIPVTVTGRGNTSYCYATIGSETVTAEGTYTAKSGSVITFGVYGSSKQSGMVKIDGTRVLIARSNATETYDWTVPSDIVSINIDLSYHGTPARPTYGTITVTTA